VGEAVPCEEGTGFDLDCLTAQVELAFSFDYVDQGRMGTEWVFNSCPAANPNSVMSLVFM
jgi:hypothetical protein